MAKDPARYMYSSHDGQLHSWLCFISCYVSIIIFVIVIVVVVISACPSVRPTSRVRSVALTILVGFILYLHILSSNFRRCVACKVAHKISKKILGICFKFVTLTSCFDLGSDVSHYYG